MMRDSFLLARAGWLDSSRMASTKARYAGKWDADRKLVRVQRGEISSELKNAVQRLLCSLDSMGFGGKGQRKGGGVAEVRGLQLGSDLHSGP